MLSSAMTTSDSCASRAASIRACSECRTRGKSGGRHVRTIASMPNSAADAAIPRPSGLVLAPFRALRYTASGPELARVLAPPYDVIDEAQRAQLGGRDTHNVVHLTL